MKETILSITEKTFIINALSEKRRLDGRKFDESRPMKIHFGSDWGCCMVTLGDTKVLAQVSCEVQQPKSTRPNEGLLLVYVELSPMGAPHFEAGRQSDLAVQLNRLLEKCLKDSRCVDLESLCITAEEKVWAVRVDINVLNHEGNLVEASSVAALTALSHFRRPDVTTTGDKTIIHDPADRDPIPITLHHHPVCVSYAVFDKGSYVVIDPTALEERVAEGQIVFGVNAYRELCGLHLGGNAPITSDMVLKYATGASKRALEVVTQMKTALAADLEERKSGVEVGFQECIEATKRLSLGKDNFCIQLFSPENTCRIKEEPMKKEKNVNDVNMSEDDSSEELIVLKTGEGSAELSERRHARKHKLQKDEETDDETDDESDESSSGDNSDADDEEEKAEVAHTVDKDSREAEPMSDSEIQVVAEYKGNETSRVIADIELSGDSEEEETITLHGQDLQKSSKIKVDESVPKTEKKEENIEDKQQSQSRGWYSKPSW